MQAMPPDAAASGAVGKPFRQAQLKIIIEEGLQRVEMKKTRYTIAGHEFVLTDQIAQASKLVLWAKGLIGEAVKGSPETSIAWAGVSIILPLLTNPQVAEEANRCGFTYVTARMRYYTELEPLVRRLGSNSGVSSGLMTVAEEHIVELYQYILEFQIRSVLRFYQNYPGRYLHDLVGAGEWEKTRQEIEKLEHTVNGDLSQINNFTSRQELESLNNASKKSFETMESLLSMSEAHLNIKKKELEILEAEAKRKLFEKEAKCLQLFRLTSDSKDVTYEWYKNRVEDRVPGTCKWFLNHENFKTWLAQDSGPLLVSADPGCGKSVLAKFLIDHELPRSPTICYFFFKDQDQNTERQALCALLHQLFSLKPSLIKHATEQFDINGPGLIDSNMLLWAILRRAVHDPQAGPVILVLDALDECAELEFENLIRNLKDDFYGHQSMPSKLKYILTSRPYEQIVSKFQGLLDTFPYVRIPGEDASEAISQEVNHVVKSRINTLAKEKRLSDTVKSRLTERLLEVPHRTYLWVYLVFDYLKVEDFKKTEKGVDAAMETLPKTIYQAYERILGRSKNDPMVRRALNIILVAQRPLTIAEINIALAVESTSKSFDDLDLEEEEEDFKSRLRSWCGLFVSINHGKIYFLHQTAREFLLGLPVPATGLEGVRWQHSFTNRDAHMVLAEICVVYLDLINSNDQSTDEGWELGRFGAFVNYAADNWAAHFLNARVSDHTDILDRTFRIYDVNSKSYATWSAIYRKNIYNFSEEVTSLWIASHFGHYCVVRRLLEKGSYIEALDTEYRRTPLYQASRNGHEAVVRLLLEKGANIEALDTNGLTPLSLASRKGQEAVVRLLLEKGANIEVLDKYGRTPLLWASRERHEAVVRLLLEKGANIEASDTRFDRTPLSWASEKGQEAVVRLLLEKGANIEASDTRFGRTPLSWASREGQEAVVRLLLEKGANIEASDTTYGQTPLSWASQEGQEAVVRLLLEKGANIEASDTRFGRTPLSWASREGQEAVVRLLLEKGADPGLGGEEHV